MEELTATRIARDHNALIGNVLDRFQSELQAITSQAQTSLAARLGRDLAIAGGRIARTRKNRKLLLAIDRLFADEMDRAGYAKLAGAFSATFPKQLPFFQDTLDLIGERIGRDLTVRFTQGDIDYLALQQTAAADSLNALPGMAGALAQQRALFAVGGLAMPELTDLLAKRFAATVPEAVRIADTSMTVFYRMASARGFERIEEDLPPATIRYAYYGPDDKVTRPFCRHLLHTGKDYARDEIERMDNGQLPNPFLTGGGYYCRHQWILAAALTMRAGKTN